MAFNQDNRTDNENKKFVADSDGNTAVRVKLVDEITLQAGKTFTIKDQDGFPIFRVDENGDLYLRGDVKRI